MEQNNIQIKDAIITDKENTSKLTFIFEYNGNRKELWYEVPKKFINEEMAMSAILLAMYIPSMNISGELCCEGKLSPKLLSNLQTIQDIMKTWSPKRFPNELKVTPEDKLEIKDYELKQKTACFFTAGIDSTNTFLKHKDELDYLIYVHNYNIKDSENNLLIYRGERNNVIQFGKKFKIPVLEIVTNIREFAKDFTDWPSQYHGSLFASVAILLSKTIGKFYLGSSHAYSSLVPYGSHPMLDYLFEVEGMRFIHDGAESTRINKIKRISKHPEVFKHLHYGCGGKDCRKLEKCIRSMIMLDLVGIRDKCPLCNRHDYTLEDVRNINIPGESDFSKAKENYRELVFFHPEKIELRKALIVAMDNYKRKRIKAGVDWIPRDLKKYL